MSCVRRSAQGARPSRWLPSTLPPRGTGRPRSPELIGGGTADGDDDDMMLLVAAAAKLPRGTVVCLAYYRARSAWTQSCVRTLRQEEIDPRYRNVDPKFIEVIENEILSEVSLCSAFESRVPGCRRDSLPAACPCVELTPRDCAMAAARQCANVDWEDIAGLKFAKKSVEEMVILPIVRCTHRDTHKGEGGAETG